MESTSTLQENWLDRLDQRLAELKAGTTISSTDLFRTIQGKELNINSREPGDVNQTIFALEMASRVSQGKIHADFDGRTVLYSAVEPS